MLDLALPLPPTLPTRVKTDLRVQETRIWSELRAAADRRDHPWRTAVLATCDEQGFPDARTVVLREVQPDARELKFYTDDRSPKVSHLRQQPRATMVVWSPALGWQLRMTLECQVRTSGLEVLSRWAQLKLTPSAHDYLSPLPPGSPLGNGGTFDGEEPDREHFAVVSAKVLKMDWLSLERTGHRRACFEADQPPSWLQP